MTSDRLELFSRELGEDNAPDLVILHGLLGTSDNWQTLGKRFAETHRVHLIDQRNHGRSPTTPCTAMKRWRKTCCTTSMNATSSARASSATAWAENGLGICPSASRPRAQTRVADMAARAYAPHHGSIFDALLSAPIDSAESRSVVETHLTNRLDDAGVVAFLMKNLRREKSGDSRGVPTSPCSHRP